MNRHKMTKPAAADTANGLQDLDQLAREIGPSNTRKTAGLQAPLAAVDHGESEAPKNCPAESDSTYPHIQLNSRWRVVACRDRVQWILQRQHGPGEPERPAATRWEGRAYCRTREGLTRSCRAYSGPIDPAAVAALRTLPDRIEPSPPPRPDGSSRPSRPTADRVPPCLCLDSWEARVVVEIRPATVIDFPEIPEFLKLTPEERRAAWADFDRRRKEDPSIKVTNGPAPLVFGGVRDG
jgi:hypothetical protein